MEFRISVVSLSYKPLVGVAKGQEKWVTFHSVLTLNRPCEVLEKWEEMRIFVNKLYGSG